MFSSASITTTFYFSSLTLVHTSLTFTVFHALMDVQNKFSTLLRSNTKVIYHFSGVVLGFVRRAVPGKLVATRFHVTSNLYFIYIQKLMNLMMLYIHNSNRSSMVTIVVSVSRSDYRRGMRRTEPEVLIV